MISGIPGSQHANSMSLFKPVVIPPAMHPPRGHAEIAPPALAPNEPKHTDIKEIQAVTSTHTTNAKLVQSPDSAAVVTDQKFEFTGNQDTVKNKTS